jgi:hypothetical protein
MSGALHLGAFMGEDALHGRHDERPEPRTRTHERPDAAHGKRLEELHDRFKALEVSLRKERDNDLRKPVEDFNDLNLFPNLTRIWRDRSKNSRTRLELGRPEEWRVLKEIFDRIEAPVDFVGAGKEAFSDLLARWDLLIDPFDLSATTDFDAIEATAEGILNAIPKLKEIAETDPERDGELELRVANALAITFTDIAASTRLLLEAIRSAKPVPVANPVEGMVISLHQAGRETDKAIVAARQKVRKCEKTVADKQKAYNNKATEVRTRALKSANERLEKAKADAAKLEAVSEPKRRRSADKLDAMGGDLTRLWSEKKEDVERLLKASRRSANAADAKVLDTVRGGLRDAFDLDLRKAFDNWTKATAATIPGAYGRQFDLDLLSVRAQELMDVSTTYVARIDDVFDRNLQTTLAPAVRDALHDIWTDLSASLGTILERLGNDLGYYHGANLKLAPEGAVAVR